VEADTKEAARNVDDAVTVEAAFNTTAPKGVVLPTAPLKKKSFVPLVSVNA
jgi:hypothetical protein